MENTRELAWHFMAERDGVPVLRDGTPLEIGKWYEHVGELEMCAAGFHASTRAMDALRYAPGNWLALVEVEDFERGDDKLVARRRRALWVFNAEELLRLFARQCALLVVHLWDCPDIVKRYLEIGDESIRDAAWAAASAAACDAQSEWLLANTQPKF